MTDDDYERRLFLSRNEIERLVRDEKLDCEFEALGTLYVYRTEEAFAKSRWIPEASSNGEGSRVARRFDRLLPRFARARTRTTSLWSTSSLPSHDFVRRRPIF